HAEVDPRGAVWMRSPCLGFCDHAPAAFLQDAGEPSREVLLGDLTADRAMNIVIPSAARDLQFPRPTADPSVATLPRDDMVLLRRIGRVDPTSISAYQATGGFDALRKAFQIGADAVIREVIDSKLMGRGGAAFPTGRKWDAVAKQPARPHYLICNADE